MAQKTSHKLYTVDYIVTQAEQEVRIGTMKT